MRIEHLDTTIEAITYTNGVAATFGREDPGRLILGQLVPVEFKGGIRVNNRDRPLVGEWPRPFLRDLHWGGKELVLPPQHGVIGITIPEELLTSGEVTWEGTTSLQLISNPDRHYLMDSHPEYAVLAFWKRLPFEVVLRQKSIGREYVTQLEEDGTMNIPKLWYPQPDEEPESSIYH